MYSRAGYGRSSVVAEPRRPDYLEREAIAVLPVLLAALGGAAGVAAGAVATASYAHIKGWAIVIPADAWAGGLAATVLIGANAGLLPALRAARMSPTQALWAI